MDKLLSSATRQWLYGILLAAIPILVVYGIVGEQEAPLWVALGAAVLGLGTALGAITGQRNAGILPDSKGKHATPEPPV